MTAVTRSKKEVRVFWKPWASRTKCTSCSASISFTKRQQTSRNGQARWRTACHDFTDDVYCSIKLLHLLDRDTVAHSKTWFDRSILKLDRDSVAELIRGR